MQSDYRTGTKTVSTTTKKGERQTIHQPGADARFLSPRRFDLRLTFFPAEFVDFAREIRDLFI
jgi:hypothetical protein